MSASPAAMPVTRPGLSTLAIDVGGGFPIVPQRGPNELACSHSGRNSRSRIRVAHSTLFHSGTEHTAALDRSTHVATFGVARAPAPRTDLTPPSASDRAVPGKNLVHPEFSLVIRSQGRVVYRGATAHLISAAIVPALASKSLPLLASYRPQGKRCGSAPVDRCLLNFRF
jgi:hypothetical protein